MTGSPPWEPGLFLAFVVDGEGEKKCFLVDVAVATTGRRRVSWTTPSRIQFVMRTTISVILGCLTLLALGEIRGDSPAGGQPAAPLPEVAFAIPQVSVQPGAIAEVPILVEADSGISMVSVSVELDTDIVDVLEVKLSTESQAIFELNEAPERDFSWVVNEEEGWLQASLVLDFRAREAVAIPPGRHPVFVVVLALRSDAASGISPLAFTRQEQARYRGNFVSIKGPVYNAARGQGKPFTDKERFEDALDPDLTDGALAIIGDIGLFLRGDANMDLKLDISDPVTVLDFLFLGAADPLPCADAADFNDDGSVDISDPIGVLGFLFLGVEMGGLAESYPGEDATPDDLGCGSY